ncbi:MAG: LCP family protein [Anaerolineae bacterium]|nr:LCP family protein [Anaerolineae bacterium]
MSQPVHNRRNKGYAGRMPEQGPLSRLRIVFERLPLPRLGPWGTIIGVGGLFFGTLAIAFVVAIVVRSLVSSRVLSGDSSLIMPPNATPNPDFMAPTLDIGNTYQWQGTDRVTVLLMGADTRPSERGKWRPRSDTIMLLMADPVNHQASVLSIPRDLYVDIPGYGLNRANTAYFLGGGPLAMETTQYNLGVRVNHYALIEFDVFITLVDEIGGLDINVPRAIYDANYPNQNYGYDPFYIEAGLQHLDGSTALKYSRTRATPGSDFDRAVRQQDILLAIRDKVLSLDMLPTLIEKAPTLYASLQQSIDTDLSLDQMMRLAVLMKDVPRENIRTGVIGADYVISYETPEGAQVEIPNRAVIGPYLEQIFWVK